MENKTDQKETCGGCALEKLCHKSIVEMAEEDSCMRRKATWLMFWIPLIIIALGLFLMVGLGGWDELLSFLIVVILLTAYYLILKFKLK